MGQYNSNLNNNNNNWSDKSPLHMFQSEAILKNMSAAVGQEFGGTSFSSSAQFDHTRLELANERLDSEENAHIVLAQSKAINANLPHYFKKQLQKQRSRGGSSLPRFQQRAVTGKLKDG